EVALERFRRHIDAISRNIEFPTMVDTPQSVFLVAAQKQRSPTMGAMFTNKRDRAARVAEGHQIFAEQPHAYGGAITARQIVGQHCRHPIAPEQFAHRCAGARPRQKLIFFTLHWGLIVAARYRSCEKNVRMLQAGVFPSLHQPLGEREFAPDSSRLAIRPPSTSDSNFAQRMDSVPTRVP